MRQHSTDVLVDVTSLISAEDFLASQNRSTEPLDPFARQCFVEVVQSLLFMSNVYVAHPVLHAPRAGDFGDRPLLLQALMRAGLIHPLRLDGEQQRSAARLEAAAVRDLQSVHGVTSMARFVEQAFVCDEASAGRQAALSTRIREWSSFQERQVRSTAGHHRDRIPTRDGVEEDAFGEWARAAAVVLRSALTGIAAPGQGEYLMATLARGMKYRARAEARVVSYQSHPLRRDFSLTFDMTRSGAADTEVLDLIQAVRGIHTSLSHAVGQSESHRLQLLELELPLLGGRLWAADDTGRRSDHEWIAFVVGRIRDYRDRASELRRAVERCVTAEDYVRLARDIEGVKRQLLERLGLRRVELSAVERELVGSVASVSGAVTGLPVVSGLWFGARSLGKQFVFGNAQPYQRFLYREFVDAWKRTGR
ncbi:hypothetical protein [Kitasatospora viridis]|uniref:Uncharacterized protein n=1 Tax=Kitasatospora viridis TaxID=281105 RepID=A0A561UDG2_9ACTN|nr:hypothetical protein [Kitasatospora viridis]TWF97365.1 hypothetical protein FHX73_111145 [Kitasatospora viridis]